MPYLVILKRFEIWLLAAVVAAVLYHAFRPGQATSEGEPAVDGKLAERGSRETLVDRPVAETAEEGEVEAVTVREVSWKGTEEGRIVELTLFGRSPSGEDLVLDESTVSASTGEGEPVALFFEPFREAAVLSGSEDSLATLRWWLERPAEVIWLDLAGRRMKAELP